MWPPVRTGARWALWFTVQWYLCAAEELLFTNKKRGAGQKQTQPREVPMRYLASRAKSRYWFQPLAHPEMHWPFRDHWETQQYTPGLASKNLISSFYQYFHASYTSLSITGLSSADSLTPTVLPTCLKTPTLGQPSHPISLCLCLDCWALQEIITGLHW